MLKLVYTDFYAHILQMVYILMYFIIKLIKVVSHIVCFSL